MVPGFGPQVRDAKPNENKHLLEYDRTLVRMPYAL